MNKPIDLSGLTFEQWKVLSEHRHNSHKQVIWKCRCICGKERMVTRGSLRNRRSLSCGCQNGKATLRHGHARKNAHTKEYTTWRNMISRCYDQNSTSYCNYGGRGIVVGDRWLLSFEDFYKDMGERPSLRHSIDRINNDGNYEPSNCRWATRREQRLNQRKRTNRGTINV